MSDTELLPKPKREPGSVHRLEGFYRGRAGTALDRGAGGAAVGPRSRRRGESYESGETVCAVARRHGLTPQQLFGWRRHTRLAEDADNKGGIAFAARPSCFHDHGRGNAPIAAARPGRSSAIKIVIGAATVRIAPGTDAARLQTVLRG